MALRFGTAQDARLPEERRRLVKLLLEEERLSRPEEALGPPMLRVRSGTSKTAKVPWRHCADEKYDYRAVLRSEVVFDQGDHGDWLRTRKDVHLLWDALNLMGVPYWGGLSGSKGIHTTTFLRPFASEAQDYRLPFVRAVQTILADLSDFHEVEMDPVTWAPAHDARLIREFGVPKEEGSARRKTLWTFGPGPYKPLPETREEAYRGPTVIPSRLPIASWPAGVWHAAMSEAFGRGCPSSGECLRMEWTPCDECPAGR